MAKKIETIVTFTVQASIVATPAKYEEERDKIQEQLQAVVGEHGSVDIEAEECEGDDDDE